MQNARLEGRALRFKNERFLSCTEGIVIRYEGNGFSSAPKSQSLFGPLGIILDAIDRLPGKAGDPRHLCNLGLLQEQVPHGIDLLRVKLGLPRWLHLHLMHASAVYRPLGFRQWGKIWKTRLRKSRSN